MADLGARFKVWLLNSMKALMVLVSLIEWSEILGYIKFYIQYSGLHASKLLWQEAWGIKLSSFRNSCFVLLCMDQELNQRMIFKSENKFELTWYMEKRISFQSCNNLYAHVTSYPSPAFQALISWTAMRCAHGRASNPSCCENLDDSSLQVSGISAWFHWY